MASPTELACMPEPCPTIYAPSVAKLDADVRMILTAERVPWGVMKLLADSTDTTLTDLAERWETKAACRAKCATEMDFKTHLHYNTEQGERAARRLAVCVQTAQDKTQRRRECYLKGEPQKLTNTDRAAMSQLYTNMTHQKLPLEEQGSDAYLAKQLAYVQQGQIGLFTSKQIVSALPTLYETVQTKRRRTDPDGLTREIDHEEQRYEPRDVEQWKKQMLIFRNTLLMTIWAHPEQSNLHLEKPELDSFYDFLYGPDILQTGPTLRVIMYAERNAWREIARQVAAGVALKTALLSAQNNSLFWQRQIYAQPGTPASTRPTYQPKGWSKGKKGSRPKGRWQKGRFATTNSWKPTQPGTYQPKGTGKTWGGKGKPATAKGKGGKNKPTYPTRAWNPNTMATVSPTGQQYCRDYVNGSCAGGCSRSHNCPITPSGQPCNQRHPASQCPHA